MLQKVRLSIGVLVVGCWLAPLVLADEPGQNQRESGGASRTPPKITVSKETTYVTGPLRPDGSVDFLAAINQQCSQGVTPENNAAVAFWQAVGPKGIKDTVRQRYFALLGIPELPETGEYLVSFSNFAPSYQEGAEELSKQFERVQEAPWSPSQSPRVAALLEKNAKSLRVLAEGAMRPRYYSPLVSAADGSLADAELAIGSPEIYEVTRQLAARGMLQLGTGNIDGVWDEILAGCRLLRLYAQQPLFIDRVIAIARQDAINRIAVALSQSKAVSADRLKEFQAQWAEMTPLPSSTDVWNGGERLYGHSYVYEIARDKDQAKAFKTIDWLFNFGDDSAKRQFQALKKIMSQKDMDWSEVLRCRNRLTDRAIQKMGLGPYSKRFAAMTAIEKEASQSAAQAADKVLSPQWDAKPPTPEAAGRQFAAILNGPGPLGFTFTAAVRVDARYTMQRQLVLLAFAMARYQRDHQKYPESLGELQPSYLDKIPNDIFNEDRPLHYKTDGKGYLVYSLGFNGKDDEGRNVLVEFKDLAELDSATEEEKSRDDIAISTPDRKPGKK